MCRVPHQVAQPELKAANFVAKWLGYGAQSLGLVVRKDGSTEDRVIETWVPKKKVKAYSLRWEYSLHSARNAGCTGLRRGFQYSGSELE